MTMQTLPKKRYFETMSYLPPLTDLEITKQVQYMLDKGYIPAIEFNETSEPTVHYWTLWKLPLLGAKSTHEVISEVDACRKAYPNCYVRMIGFDNIRQCQAASFIVYKP
jgi:ribulose-bisphosphate carboxylase small chain